MTQPDLKRAARHARHARRLGDNPACHRCGWTDPVALTKKGEVITCYACLRPDGKATEDHHLHGRRNDPATIPVERNIHRSLSDHQIDWPAGVLRNPERDPLLWLAAAMFGLHDHLAWWVDWLERIARWLVQLAESLQTQDGPRWWETRSLAPIWQGTDS